MRCADALACGRAYLPSGRPHAETVYAEDRAAPGIINPHALKSILFPKCRDGIDSGPPTENLKPRPACATCYAVAGRDISRRTPAGDIIKGLEDAG